VGWGGVGWGVMGWGGVRWGGVGWGEVGWGTFFKLQIQLCKLVPFLAGHLLTTYGILAQSQSEFDCNRKLNLTSVLMVTGSLDKGLIARSGGLHSLS
jgi:hypothetical protein